jgi:hypothetical protein
MIEALKRRFVVDGSEHGKLVDRMAGDANGHVTKDYGTNS